MVITPGKPWQSTASRPALRRRSQDLRSPRDGFERREFLDQAVLVRPPVLLPAPGPSNRVSIAKLDRLLEETTSRGLAGRAGATVNEPRPDLFEEPIEAFYQQLDSPSMRERVAGNAVLQALHTQVMTTLKHVRLDFCRRDQNYVHDDVLAGAYPFRPSLRALTDVRNFLDVLEARPNSPAPAFPPAAEVKAELQQLEERHKGYLKQVIAEPLKFYQDFRTRLSEQGPEAPFPEFADTLRYLELHLSKEGVAEVAGADPHLARARAIAMENLKAAKEAGCPYRRSVDVIQDALAVLDVYERGRPHSEARPKLYHAERYQYYGEYIKSEIPEHITFPTFYGLGATDLLKTRGVPLGFVGVVPELSWVDGYSQTPLEFWYHDINHTRRMWQFLTERAEQKGVPIQQYIEQCDNYLKSDVIPLLKIDKSESPEAKNTKRMMKLILFEILHEDALPAEPDVIRQALLRAPNTLTPFEQMINDQRTVQYIMEPGATTLAYVYRKAAGMFYDLPGMRMENIVGVDYRSQDFVAHAAKALADRLKLNVPGILIEAYTRDDTGMPGDFRAQLEQQLREDPNRMAPLNMKAEAPAAIAWNLTP